MSDSPNQRTERAFSYKGYWLERLPNTPYWYRVRRHEGAYEKVSLRQSDLGLAQRKLIDFVDSALTPNQRDPKAVRLHSLLDHYYEFRSPHVANPKMIATANRFWKEHFPIETVVDDVTELAISEFSTTLRQAGKSLGYISRILGVGRAALHLGKRHRYVSSIPDVIDCQTQEDRENVEPLGRPLTVTELARLFIACTHPHIHVFMLIALHTLSRPTAIFELTRQQIDFDHDLVNLNPQGRRQTKKRRPILKMTKRLRAILQKIESDAVAAAAEDGNFKFTFQHYVTFRGEAVKDIHKAFENVVEDAGLGGTNVTRYSIRHTMGRVLQAARVPTEEISFFLGHKVAGVSKATEVYAPFSPEYCSHAVAAIEAYAEKLQAEIARLLAEKRTETQVA